MDERVCIVCGATFMPKTHQQKCCSAKCSSQNANAKKEEYRRARGERELATIERVCTVCGATFHPNSYNQICCRKECSRENFLVKCREHRRREYAEKKAKATEKKQVSPKTDHIPSGKRKSVCDSYCDGCVFLGYANGGLKLCEYLLRTNRRRPCPAGKGCTVKQTGKKKSTWRYEADETWEIKKKKEKEKTVLHKVCPCCGVDFETTDPRKIFCCRRCNTRTAQRNHYKKIREERLNAKT